MIILKSKIRKKISQLEMIKKNDQGILDDLLKGGNIHIDFGEDMTKLEKIDLYKIYVNYSEHTIKEIEDLLK